MKKMAEKYQNPELVKLAAEIKAAHYDEMSKILFELAEKITQVRKNEEPLIEEEIVRQKEMKSLLEKGQFFLKIPLFQGDVHDLEGLWSIASYL